MRAYNNHNPFNEIMQGAPVQERLDALTTFANEQEATMMAELQ